MKNEIKFWVGITVELLMLLMVSIANNVILLSLHPIEYYYTLPGMGLSFAAMTIEVPVIILAMWLINRFLIKPYSNDLKKS